MIEFARKPARMRSLVMTSLIDVVFILIIFFMLTSSFMRVESMELLLPSAGSKGAAANETSRVIIWNDGRMTFGQRAVSEAELRQTLQTLFTGDAMRRIVVFADDQVSMQKLVAVMDMVTLAGGRSMYVRALDKSNAPRR